MESVLISIPIGILVGAINMSNNIRDIEEDTRGGRKTLPILLGRERAVTFLGLAFATAYLWIVLIVAVRLHQSVGLVLFLGLKKPISAIVGFKKESKNHNI